MNPIALTSAAKWIGAGLIVLAILGLAAWIGHDLEAAGQAKAKAAQAEQAARDMAQARAREQALQTSKEESDREASTFNARAAADRGAAAGAADRLQQRFAAINGACVPPGAGAVAPGDPASSAADLRADVQRRLDEAAGQLAAYADAVRSAADNAARQHAAAVTP